MSNNGSLSNNRSRRHLGSILGSLAIAAAVGVFGLAGSTAAHAQATAGSIFGKAPAGATISARNTTGAQRHVSVDTRGRYTIGALPVGIYTVELELDGHVVSQKNGVQIIVGRGFKLDFDCAQNECKGPGNNG